MQWLSMIFTQSQRVGTSNEGVALLLDGHLHSCVVEGAKEGGEREVLDEFIELYQVAKR